jgi:predicted GNAT family acetyltransferase
MAYPPKYNSFYIGRSVKPESILEIHNYMNDNLGTYKDRTDLRDAHVSLFKLSMLSRASRKRYSPPHASELNSRALIGTKSIWRPQDDAKFQAIDALAHSGNIMLILDNTEVSPEYSGAGYAAKVTKEDLSSTFAFRPHIIVSYYDEKSYEAMDKLYEDEALIKNALAENPIEISFATVVALAARGRHDNSTLYHAF